MSKVKEYYDLYKLSQERIRQEQMISESLLHSIIREARKRETQFVADIVSYYYSEDTKKAWNKQFFAKMEEYFFGEVPWEFGTIIAGGYERYYYRIEFKMNNTKYALIIPNPMEITPSNLAHVSFGRYELSKNTYGCVWSTICASYEIQEIAEAIRKEYENEKE